jgi:phage repressor protein C with HTH and peptisase S24 domain
MTSFSINYFDYSAVMSIHSLIRQGRERLKLSEEAFGKLFDVSRGTIQQWEKEGGTAPNRKRQPAVAQALGISVSQLMSGSESFSPEIELENNPDYPAVKRVHFKLSAGTSGFGVDYDSETDKAPIVFSRDWYASRKLNPAALFAVKVANGSMESGLHDGDTVIVNTLQKEPKDGTVFAVNYEGQLVIKRMIRDAGEWWLSSDNPDQRRYPRKLCDENTFIIGEIVHKQSERI